MWSGSETTDVVAAVLSCLKAIKTYRPGIGDDDESGRGSTLIRPKVNESTSKSDSSDWCGG